MQPLTVYIKNPELIDAQLVEELWQLVDRHPTYQAARLLLIQGLYQLQDQRFGVALRKAALMVPDRTKLFDMIEGGKYRLQPQLRVSQVPSPQEPATDRTQSLIDTFLSTLPEEPRARRPRPTDASADYMSYLLQMEDALQSVSSSAETESVTEAVASSAPGVGEKIGQGTEAPVGVGDDDEWLEVEEEGDKNAPSEAYFTETLARIYIKQGKYDKAIEIIRRLSLNYPKKSRYFADQIRFLRKLILNERSKNEEK